MNSIVDSIGEYRKSESVFPRCSVKKGVLRNFAKFTGKHLCQSLFFNKVAGFFKKETLIQVFSCEFCEIFKNNFFYRTPLVAASRKECFRFYVSVTWVQSSLVSLKSFS